MCSNVTQILKKINGLCNNFVINFKNRLTFRLFHGRMVSVDNSKYILNTELFSSGLVYYYENSKRLREVSRSKDK